MNSMGILFCVSGQVLALFLSALHALHLVLYFNFLMRMKDCSSSTKASERELVTKAIITLVLRRRLINSTLSFFVFEGM